MKSSFSPGGSTKLLALLAIVVGATGFARLVTALGASTRTAAVFAVAYPWLPFTAKIYLDYKNDHWACAIAPWIFLAMISIRPLSEKPENVATLVKAALYVGGALLVKYSLIPLMFASLVYLLWLDGIDVSRSRLTRLLVFGSASILPGTVLWFFNYLNEVVAYPLRLGRGLSFSPVVLAKNILSNTVGTPFGFNLLLVNFHIWLQRHSKLAVPRGTLIVVCLLIVAVWITCFRDAKLEGVRRAYLTYVAIATIVLWVMLAIMVVSSGFQLDFSADVRFYMPISLAWFAMFSVWLADAGMTQMKRYTALLTLVLPVAFSVAYFAHQGVKGTPFVAMPRSRTAWLEYNPAAPGQVASLAKQDPAHAAFLENTVERLGRKPDLLVTDHGRFMTELGVPAYFTFRATSNNGHIYYSSRPLEVWAMVPPSESRVLLSKFARASKREELETPPGFPYVFYIFKYTPQVSF